MTRYLRSGLIVCAVVLLAGLPAQAQGKQKAKKKAPKPVAAEVAAPAEIAAEQAAPAPVPENTLELCQDKTDNDGDGHVDCADQDCEVFTLCLRPVMVSPLPPPPPPQYVAPAPPPPPAEERGWMCSDGVDNDRDGLTDCFEKSCQSGRRCRREIYYVPEPETKAPGLIVSFGGGLAVPNFRGNRSEGHSDVYGDIPFHPDLGGLLNLSVGVLPVRWFGVGVNLMAGASFGSNRRSWEADEDVDDPTFRDPYKYDAYKGFGHLGGFVRFQWPFDRFVPYIQLAGGYTYARERWWIYNGSESWANIDENDESELDGTREHDIKVFRHFTASIEPGFDLFIRKRTFAVGLRAWLPVWATSDPDVDNIGVMLNFTFTPLWRERPVMKPEYANPASTLEEETGATEPPVAAAPEPAPSEPVAAATAPAPATEAPAPPPPAPDLAIEDPYAAPAQ